MSEITRTVCDACGAVQGEGREGWSWFGRESTSLEVVNGKIVDCGGSFDLCPECSEPVWGLIRAMVGEKGGIYGGA